MRPHWSSRHRLLGRLLEAGAIGLQGRALDFFFLAVGVLALVLDHLIGVVGEAPAGDLEAGLGADLLEDLFGLDDRTVDEAAGMGDEQDLLCAGGRLVVGRGGPGEARAPPGRRRTGRGVTDASWCSS